MIGVINSLFLVLKVRDIFIISVFGYRFFNLKKESKFRMEIVRYYRNVFALEIYYSLFVNFIIMLGLF